MTAVVGPDVDRASASPPTELTVLERIGQPFGLVALILLFLALQALYGAHLPLFGDEAYYWAWSRQPALSYFDHPPMVAWLLRLATMLATSEAAVRLVPLLCTGLSAWLVQALARDVYGKRAAVIAQAPEFRARVAQAMAARFPEDPAAPTPPVEKQIFGGFYSHADKALLAEFQRADWRRRIGGACAARSCLDGGRLCI